MSQSSPNNTPPDYQAIINDMQKSGSLPSNQQMIVNDLFSTTDTSGQMTVNDQSGAAINQPQNLQSPQSAQSSPAGHPSINNDMPPHTHAPAGSNSAPQPSPSSPPGIVNDLPKGDLSEEFQKARIAANAEEAARRSQSVERILASAEKDTQNAGSAGQAPRAMPAAHSATIPPRPTPGPTRPQTSPAPAAKNALPSKKKTTRSAKAMSNGKPLDPKKEWQGGYSAWTLLPSNTLCILLSAATLWLVLRFVPAGFWLMTLPCVLTAIWGVQIVRWLYRTRSFKYLLSSEKLTIHRGWLYGEPIEIPRTKIGKVAVTSNWIESFVGIGRVVIEVKDENPHFVHLEGVRDARGIFDSKAQTGRLSGAGVR